MCLEEEVGVEGGDKSRDVYGGVRGLERRNRDVVKKMQESREGEAQWLWRKNRGKGWVEKTGFCGRESLFLLPVGFWYQGPPYFRTWGGHQASRF